MHCDLFVQNTVTSFVTNLNFFSIYGSSGVTKSFNNGTEFADFRGLLN